MFARLLALAAEERYYFECAFVDQQLLMGELGDKTRLKERFDKEREIVHAFVDYIADEIAEIFAGYAKHQFHVANQLLENAGDSKLPIPKYLEDMASPLNLNDFIAHLKDDSNFLERAAIKLGLGDLAQLEQENTKPGNVADFSHEKAEQLTMREITMREIEE